MASFLDIVVDMDELEEQLKVLRLQLEQSRSQTADAQQEMAAAEVHWEAQNTHLQQELRLSNLAGARAEVPAPAQRVYVQRERRFRKQCGQPETAEDPDVDDWAADTESHLKASLLSDCEGLNFIFDHLSGAAGIEVRFREPGTAAEALRVVQRVFGDVDTVGAAQEAFYTRNQQPGETLKRLFPRTSQAVLKAVLAANKPDGTEGRDFERSFCRRCARSTPATGDAPT